MPKTSEAMRRAIAKNQAKHDAITFRVPKGKKDELQRYAKSQGLSLQAWLIQMIEAQSGLSIREKENRTDDTGGAT